MASSWFATSLPRCSGYGTCPFLGWSCEGWASVQLLVSGLLVRGWISVVERWRREPRSSWLLPASEDTGFLLRRSRVWPHCSIISFLVSQINNALLQIFLAGRIFSWVRIFNHTLSCKGSPTCYSASLNFLGVTDWSGAASLSANLVRRLCAGACYFFESLLVFNCCSDQALSTRILQRASTISSRSKAIRGWVDRSYARLSASSSIALPVELFSNIGHLPGVDVRMAWKVWKFFLDWVVDIIQFFPLVTAHRSIEQPALRTSCQIVMRINTSSGLLPVKLAWGGWLVWSASDIISWQRTRP